MFLPPQTPDDSPRKRALYGLGLSAIDLAMKSKITPGDAEAVLNVITVRAKMSDDEASDVEADALGSSAGLQAAADRIQAAWESSRICPHAGQGMRSRIVRAASLVDAGTLSLEAAGRVAAEAESLALAFAPLPSPAA